MEAGGIATHRRWCSDAMLGRSCTVGVMLASGSLLAAATVLLPLRRFAGGLNTPLSPMALLLAAVILVALVTGYRWALSAAESSAADRRRAPFWIARVAPGFALVAVGWAISLPSSSWYGLALLWSVIVAEEISYWRIAVRGPFHRSERPAAAPDAVKPNVRSEPSELNEPHALPGDLSQRMDRGRTDDDQDVCHGHVRSCFQKGQRTDTIHLAFCPPFLQTPELHIEQVDGPDAQIKTTQILPYGARLEVRLAKASTQPEMTLIEFSAIA